MHDNAGDSLRETMPDPPRRLAGGHSLVASLTSEEGLKAFVREVGEALDVSLVDVWAFAGEREALVYEALWHRGGGADSQAAVGTWVPLEERPDLRAVIESGAPVERHLDDPDLPDELRSFLSRRGYRSAFDLPLRAAGETIGVLGLVETRTVRRFGDNERDLLGRICELATLGVQNAWARRRDAEREQHLGTLLAASRGLSATLDGREAIARLVGAVDELLAGIAHQTVVYLRRDDNTYAPLDGHGATTGAGEGRQPRSPALTDEGAPDTLAFRSLERRRAAQARTGGSPTRLVLPLAAGREAHGFVDVRGAPLRRFAVDEVAMLQIMADNATTALNHARLNRNMDRQAAVDPVTGFFNRWYFYERLYSEAARAVRYRQPLSVVLIGIDSFGEFVQSRGRANGDYIVKSIARLLAAGLRRKVDVACRHGDGEFGLLLPSTPPFSPGAALVAERLRRNIEVLEFRNEDHENLGCFTLSLGIAGFPQHAEDAEELGEYAARALRQAREEGGNRLKVYGQGRFGSQGQAGAGAADDGPDGGRSSPRRETVVALGDVLGEGAELFSRGRDDDED